MKILTVIHSLETGGAEKQVVVDANSLIKRGHQVTIALYQKGGLYNLLDKKIDLLKFRTDNEILALFHLFYHLLSNKYDVIHAHMFWAEKVSSLSARFTNHRLIFNEHGLGLWRKWYHIWIMAFISTCANKIINSCDATRKIRHEKEKINKKKLSTIYNSFEISNDCTLTDTEIKFKKLDEFIIGYVGRFNHIKRLPIFIEIAERLKNKIPKFKIILVGDGLEKEKIEHEIETKQLSKYFLLTGFTLFPQKYLKLFDIFLLPSKREAFSVALLEAAAAGIPSIGFDVGGNAELIANNVTGYIIPDGDLTMLTDKITYLYHHPKIKNEMGYAAIQNVKANFSTEIRVKKLENLYQNL